MDFIEIVKCYLKNEKLNNEIYDKELLKIAIDQSLETILYPVTSNISYINYYISWVHLQEKFYKIQDEITDILNKNNIKHLYFKGSIISKLYDDPSVRTRGDIDLYVDINDLEKAKSLLIDASYIVDSKGMDTHDIPLHKNDIMIELHYSLFDDSHKKEVVEYFNKPFDKSVKVSDSLYQLDDTYHFIYCLEHFSHHLRQGAGIRYILDFYYMLKKSSIDLELLHNEINKLGLSKLYNNVLNVIYFLTDIEFDTFTKEDITYFIEYMLKSGIHGHSKLNNDSTAQAVAHVDKKRYFMVKVFLTNKKYRKALYPKIGSKAILYPICLIRHWLFLLTHRFTSLFKFLFGKNKKKELYKKLGI